MITKFLDIILKALLTLEIVSGQTKRTERFKMRLRKRSRLFLVE